MNFQTMDSLGGLIEGNKARMAEDSTRINQDSVLQQIASAAQKMQQEAALHPGALQEQQARIGQTQAQTGEIAQRTDASRQEQNRKALKSYVDDVIQFGSVPGAADASGAMNRIPANHPVREAARKAWDASQGWDPKQGPSPIEQLSEKLAQSDQASRQKRADAEAQFKREGARQDAMTARQAATDASRERIATANRLARQSAQELALKAKEMRDPDLEAYATRLMAQADAAAAEGNAAQAQKLRIDAENAMQQAIRLQAAKGTAKEETEAARLDAITGGKLKTVGSGTAGANRAAAGGPAVGGATAQQGGTAKSGNKFTVIPPTQNPNPAAGQGAPSPAVTPAPQSSSTQVPTEMVVPAAYTEGTLKREGTGKNPRSSAVGTGQFIDSTMLAKFKEWYPESAKDMSDEEILDLRLTNPGLMAKMTERYAKTNAAILKKEGHEVSDGTLYLAHHFGPTGALSLLNAPDKWIRSVENVLPAAVIKANPHLRGKTVQQVIDWAKNNRFH